MDRITQSQKTFKIVGRLLQRSSFSHFMVLFYFLFLGTILLPIDLELVMGPSGAIGVGAPGGFADDESCPST